MFGFCFKGGEGRGGARTISFPGTLFSASHGREAGKRDPGNKVGDRAGGEGMRELGEEGEHKYACFSFLRCTRFKICQESLLANEIK